LSVIERAVVAISTHTLTQELRQQAQREAHTLKGSLGLFGLEEAAQLCREIEQLLRASDGLSQSQVEQLSRLVKTVWHQLGTHTLDQNRISIADVSMQLETVQLETVQLEEMPRFVLLIVDDDVALAEQIARAAIAHNIQAITVTSLAQARAAIAHTPPQIVLLDLTFADSAASGLELLEELSVQQPSIPVVVFTAQEAFVDRVRVAQLGGKGFLQKPIAPTQVVEAIVQVMQHSTTSEAMLLVVDDDPAILATLRTLLEPWGFQVTLLDDPTQFWDTLERIHPDLLILDIEMPGFNGIELCQVVRNDLRWAELPILILSAHNDDHTLQRVFMAGADDYVSKPIRSAELVARVLGRLERSKLRQKLRRLEG
ncbi:MAG: response regulator, partial [Leptolyngbyaceae cyanobacterium RU_5_1]|nr:response regulator [Leptolyngbyaceae cyanobacterium RU_5_1]